MSKTFLVYANEKIGNAVKKVVKKKSNIVKIETLSQLHAACRKIPADVLFIGEEEWEVFGCTALHPNIAPHIHFPIILVSGNFSDIPKKQEIVFRFVSVPESQKSFTEKVGYPASFRPFLRVISLLFIGKRIKVLGPADPAKEICKAQKDEMEKQAEIIRRLCACTHEKCAKILDLVLGSGEMGASVNFLRLQVWPDSVKSHKNSIQAYICKIRKTMRECPECNCTIAHRDGKYFLVQEKDGNVGNKKEAGGTES